MKISKLDFVIVICWAVIMIVEVIGLKIFILQFGNSTQTYGTLLLIVMSALSCGYFIGGKLADQYPTKEAFGIVLLSSVVFIFMIPILRGFSQSIYFQSLLFILPTIFLGMSSPYGSRLKIQNIHNSGKVFGNVSLLSGIGSIIGLFFGSFVLTNYFHINEIFYLCGFLMYVAYSLLKSNKIYLILSIIILSVFSYSALYQSEDVNVINEPLGYTNSLEDLIGVKQGQAYAEDDYYGLVVVNDVNRPSKDDIIREIFINNQTMGVMNMTNKSQVLEGWQYMECLMLPLTQDNQIKEVLVIGLGAGILPSKIEIEYLHINVTVVEINAAVISIADTFFGIRETNKLKIIKDDGRNYLKNTNKKYDLIVVDAYHGNNSLVLPFELITKEFYELTKQHLTKDGQISVMLNSEVRLSEPQDYQSIYKTINNVYDYDYVFDCNLQVIIASNNPKDYSNTQSPGVYYEVDDLSQAQILTDEFFPWK